MASHRIARFEILLPALIAIANNVTRELWKIDKFAKTIERNAPNIGEYEWKIQKKKCESGTHQP